MKIKVLPDDIINKIAAGEVIENTASVVKELVDNALDAGATHITVEIKGGGRQLIRISDNGCGMAQDDALLCLERHATSKIRAFEDLDRVATMGFRGEAIPSIASISKFTLITSPKENPDAASMVIVEGGKILQCTSAVRSPGTTVEVKNLFFNVPVRKKFQRSPAYDSAEVVKTLSQLALGYPHIAFELISDQRQVLNAPAAPGSWMDQLKSRIQQTLGDEYAEALLQVEYQHDWLSMRGYIGIPSYTRNNRQSQYVLMNQRPVWSPLISGSVRDGYGTAIAPQRYPVFVLHVTVPGEYVDVNVHPQKREVRLRQELLFRERIRNAVAEALHGCAGENESFASAVFPSEPISFSEFAPSASWMDQVQKPVNTPLPRAPQPAPTFFATPKALLPKALAYKVVSTLPGYFLIEASGLPGSLSKEGLYIIDQKRAHFRVLFEALSRKGAKEVQQLLIPETVELTRSESETYGHAISFLEELGIHTQEFGRDTLSIHSIPTCLTGHDIPALLRTILAEVKQYESSREVETRRQQHILTLAQRAAASKQKRLEVVEAQGLLRQLLACQVVDHCPQGKPILSHLGQEELTKHFNSL